MTALPSVLYPQPAATRSSPATARPRPTASRQLRQPHGPGRVGPAPPRSRSASCPSSSSASTGAPVSGAAIIAHLHHQLRSGYDSYDLPVTDGYGQSVISVPYGTYSYTVTIGGSVRSPTPR